MGGISSRRMIVFPHAKINLGLNVIGKRADGYHDIESVLIPIPLHDALEAIVDDALPANEVVFTCSGLPVPGEPEQNLCLRAVQMLQARGQLPGIRIHLHKVIPMGAGLGGGSSDGAHMLMLVNDLCSLGLGREELMPMASSLGSDVPFFLSNTAQLAEGRGERLRPVSVDLRGTWLVLVNPGIHVPTADVYTHTPCTGGYMDLAAILEREPMDRWQELAPNTMAPYVFETWATVAELQGIMRMAGATYCAMSGSGSSVFGLFRGKPADLEFPAGSLSWTVQL